LAEDAEAQVVNSEQYTGVSLLHERIITKVLTTMVFLCKPLTPLGHLSRQSYGEWVHALLNQVAYNNHNCYRNGEKGQKRIGHLQ